MRRFERGEGKQRRFWQVDVEGRWLVTRFGRIGTEGTTNRKLCPTPSKARAEAKKATQTRVGAGWAEVDPRAAVNLDDLSPKVVWRPGDRKQVLRFAPKPGPRRLPDGRETWRSVLGRARRPLEAARAGLEKSDAALLPVAGAVGRLTKEPPEALDRDTQAAFLALHWSPGLIDAWLALAGPVFAVQALAHAGRFAWASPDHTTNITWLKAGGGLHRPFRQQGPVARLRRRLATAPDEDRIAAEAAAAALRPGLDIGSRVALSAVFPWRATWVAEDLATVLSQQMATPQKLCLLAGTDDPDGAVALIDKVWASAPPTLAAMPWVWTLIARLGLAAAPAVARMAELAKHRDTTDVLTRLSCPESANTLVALLAVEPEVASDALQGMPHFAIPALRKAKAAKVKKRAGPLLAQLESQYPQLAGIEAAGVVEASALDPAFTSPPLDTLPPDWLRPTRLPRPTLRDGTALPPEVVGVMARWLQQCELVRHPEALHIWARDCDPTSLGAFALGLLDAWELAGLPRADRWVVFAAGHLADDALVRELASRVVRWPRDGHYPQAIHGVDALARIGTDQALMQLLSLHSKTGFRIVKERADLHIKGLSQALGLTQLEVEERLVPDLGLDPSGGLVLDFGPRQFRVSFDHHLKPVLADAEGRPVDRLPRPRKTDDPELSAAAVASWRAMKADVRTLAKAQLKRLEHAMIERRRWSVETFERYQVQHRLLSHLVRRLLWLTDEGQAFRVAADGSYADIEDEPLALDPAARIRVAHPIDLSAADRATWSEQLADYELLQPFDQLSRHCPTPRPDEQKTRVLTRLTGRTVSVGRILGLAHRGWRRQRIHEDEGGLSPFVDTWTRTQLGHTTTFTISPPLNLEALDPTEERTLDEVRGDRHWGTADPLVFTEVLRDLPLAEDGPAPP